MTNSMKIHHYRRDGGSPSQDMSEQLDAIYAEAKALHEQPGGDDTERMATLWHDYQALLVKYERITGIPAR